MSRRIEPGPRRQEGSSPGKSVLADRSSNIAILQDVETLSLTISETVCESPLCAVSFPESGLACKPKRFCSDGCRLDAWAIKHVAELFGVTVERMVEVLRK